MAMARPLVLFGIGATKAGTSWLHRYLSDHPDCAMPRIKELHFFDMAENGVLDRELKRVRQRRQRLARSIADASGRQRAEREAGVAAFDRWAEVLRGGSADLSAYLRFLTEGAEGRRVVGDMTPAYALLSEATLLRMATIAPVVRFVYLLRDPVDRLWSHLRMIAQRIAAGPGDVGPRALSIFDDWAEGRHPEVDARGDYAAILPKLGRALPAGSLLIEFYERLFSDVAVNRLCDFLGIARIPGRYGQRVHETAAVALGAERLAGARRRLLPQYAAVEKMLGALPARWQENYRMGEA